MGSLDSLANLRNLIPPMDTTASTPRSKPPTGEGSSTAQPPHAAKPGGDVGWRASPVGVFFRSWIATLSRQALVCAWFLSVGLHLLVLGTMVFVVASDPSGGFNAEVANVRAVISEIAPRANVGAAVRAEEVALPERIVPPAAVEPSDLITRPMPASASMVPGLGVGAGAGPGMSGGGDGVPVAGRGGGGLPIIGLGGGGFGGGRGDLGAMGLTLGGGGGPQFFGVGGSAKEVEKIVYVVDRSGSMSDTFRYVRKELVRSVSALRRAQRFHVIFFNSGVPLENPPKRLVSAVEANREEFFAFLETVSPGGSTNPEQAMYLALSLSPDLVYFLSDGAFDVAFVNKLAEWNRDRGVKICTIAYLDREGSAILERIARENDGEFRYVSENELP